MDYLDKLDDPGVAAVCPGCGWDTRLAPAGEICPNCGGQLVFQDDAAAADLPPLESISGIGPATARRLREAGVVGLAALARLGDEELEALDCRPEWRQTARDVVDASRSD